MVSNIHVGSMKAAKRMVSITRHPIGCDGPLGREKIDNFPPPFYMLLEAALEPKDYHSVIRSVFKHTQAG